MMTPEEAIALQLKDPKVRVFVAHEIGKALKPILDQMAQLNNRMEALERKMNAWTGNIQGRVNRIEDRKVHKELSRRELHEMIDDKIKGKDLPVNEKVLRMAEAATKGRKR